MTTYLIPLCNGEGFCWIESINANSISDAEDAFIEKMIDEYDLETSAMIWKDFCNDFFDETNVKVGNFYDVNEFI